MDYVERVKAAWQSRLAALAPYGLTAREEIACEAEAAWRCGHPGAHRLTRAQLRNCWALFDHEADAFERKLAQAGVPLQMEV